MRRAIIEKLTKIYVKPAKRIANLRLLDENNEELPDILEFSLHFDSNWKHALLYIAVTDEKGHLVMVRDEKNAFGPMRIKTLKKRVNFEFVGVN